MNEGYHLTRLRHRAFCGIATAKMSISCPTQYVQRGPAGSCLAHVSQHQKSHVSCVILRQDPQNVDSSKCYMPWQGLQVVAPHSPSCAGTTPPLGFKTLLLALCFAADMTLDNPLLRSQESDKHAASLGLALLCFMHICRNGIMLSQWDSRYGARQQGQCMPLLCCLESSLATCVDVNVVRPDVFQILAGALVQWAFLNLLFSCQLFCWGLAS